MSLQIVEGDVMRGEDIPFIFVIPRYFTCPSITNSDLFSVSFIISVNVTFINGFTASESLDIDLKRVK